MLEPITGAPCRQTLVYSWITSEHPYTCAHACICTRTHTSRRSLTHTNSQRFAENSRCTVWSSRLFFFSRYELISCPIWVVLSVWTQISSCPHQTSQWRIKKCDLLLWHGFWYWCKCVKEKKNLLICCEFHTNSVFTRYKTTSLLSTENRNLRPSRTHPHPNWTVRTGLLFDCPL